MSTKIEWTDETWNVSTGCSKVSSGCAHCYAEREWKRLAGNPITAYFGREFNDVACHPERLDQPLRWKRPRKIFVNSMSDLFHDDVPFEFIWSVWARMVTNRQHTYMILTKRPKRMLEFFAWNAEQEFKVETSLGNIWLGVSVEDQATADERIALLLQAPAEVRFISAEPLLGPIDLSRYLGGFCPPGCIKDFTCSIHCGHRKRNGLNLVIAGGESGPRARPMHPDWVMSLRDQCQAAGTKFFFKQWGEFKEYRRYNSWPKYCDSVGLTSRIIDSKKSGRSLLLNADASDLVNGGPEHKVYPISHLQRVGKKKAGRELDGRTWDELPKIGDQK